MVNDEVLAMISVLLSNTDKMIMCSYTEFNLTEHRNIIKHSPWPAQPSNLNMRGFGAGNFGSKMEQHSVQNYSDILRIYCVKH